MYNKLLYVENSLFPIYNIEALKYYNQCTDIIKMIF